MTKTDAVVIEPAGSGFSAYVPDLPGCVAAAPSRSVEMVSVLVSGAEAAGRERAFGTGRCLAEAARGLFWLALLAAQGEANPGSPP